MALAAVRTVPTTSVENRQHKRHVRAHGEERKDDCQCWWSSFSQLAVNEQAQSHQQRGDIYAESQSLQDV